MKKLQFILLAQILLILQACSQSPTLSEKTKKEIVRVNYGIWKKAELIAKTPKIIDFFKIDSASVSIFASPADKIAKKAEYTLYKDEYEYFKYLVYTLPVDSVVNIMLKKGTKPFDSIPVKKYQQQIHKTDTLLPLSGYRIALDPGHVAGSIAGAKLEDRIIQILRKPSDTLQFYEAKLAYGCVKFLEDTLQKLGAKTFVTRKQNGYTAFGCTFDEWYKSKLKDAVANELKRKNISQDAANKFLKTPKKRDVFHNLFSRLDMEERANKVNAFQPHLTVVVHFNIDEENYRKNIKKNTLDFTDKNYSMVFVPGSFSSDKLDKARKRFELLRLLITDDIKTSVEFAKIAEEHFQSRLGILPVDNTWNISYLRDNCIYMNFPGVYARNLALTNLINGTICYGETLLQDNKNEALELVKEEIPIAEIKSNKRMKEVAYSFLDAILEYFQAYNEK